MCSPCLPNPPKHSYFNLHTQTPFSNPNLHSAISSFFHQKPHKLFLSTFSNLFLHLKLFFNPFLPFSASDRVYPLYCQLCAISNSTLFYSILNFPFYTLLFAPYQANKRSPEVLTAPRINERIPDRIEMWENYEDVHHRGWEVATRAVVEDGVHDIEGGPG